ncbi:hypothetical protein AX016_2104 [Cellulophaga sp. RHA19]|nr:hypothetical protein AX016_2104 [Cellulophaga sp. RHA19]
MLKKSLKNRKISPLKKQLITKMLRLKKIQNGTVKKLKIDKQNIY